MISIFLNCYVNIAKIVNTKFISCYVSTSLEFVETIYIDK